jgi:hypothetical protein
MELHGTPGDLHHSPQDALTYSTSYETFWATYIHDHPEVQNIFANATKVCDLACGSGASTIFISRHCPQADIVTVDIHKSPFPEIVQLLKGKHLRHEDDTASNFLSKTNDAFDIVFLVKAPNVLKPEDCANLAKCVRNKGLVLELYDDVSLPKEMSQYFEPIYDISDYSRGPSWQQINIVWRKK